MAEEDIKEEEQEEIAEQAPLEEPVDVQLEEPQDDMSEEIEEGIEELKDFYSNLAEDMDERQLGQLASELISDYKRDRESRGDWEKSYTSGLDLLGFKYNDEGQPFKGASGVTHPLLAESVTQFQAQAYKELLPSDGPVRTQIVGAITSQKEQQATRVKNFMNYQVMEVMEEYTPDFDQMLFYLPLAGSAFKKIYFDELLGRAVSKFVPAEDLVVPYYVSDLKEAERITHVIKMSENDILKKQKNGFYRDVPITPSQQDDSDIQDKYNQLDGVDKGDNTDYQFSVLEMHVHLDLEFESDKKNVKIPYIVTIDEGSQEILSVYRNYKPDDDNFVRTEYFVHYKFLPGLGFYGFGLIHMIGGLSRTATAALRQLLDAGTLSNLPAGFKSRGLRIRDDDQPFQPGEFRDVDAPGGNIKDQFQILPFKEPSGTLFQLLGFVVQAGQRFASIADMAVGTDTQNRAVGTTVALLERGSRVMSAIHKRCYYGMRQEFRLLSKVFATYLPPVYPYQVYGADQFIKLMDFGPEVDIIPVADPNIFSMAQRVTLARTQLEIALSNPQMHNVREAFRRVYESLGTKQVDALLKPEEKPMPKDPAIENSEALQMKIPKAFPTQNHDAHIISHQNFIKTRMVQVNPMVNALLQAHVMEHVSFKAQAQVYAIIMQDEKLKQLSINNPQAFQAQYDSMVALRIAEFTEEMTKAEMGNQKPDPLVMLKQQELDLKAMDLQRKAGENQQMSQQKAQQFEEKIDLEKMKREDQVAQAGERIRVADDKIEIAAMNKVADTFKEKQSGR